VLFTPAAHEPLTDARWDEARARDGIRAIVADAEGAVADAAWPVHPRDAGDDLPPAPTTVYLGSAGTIWALAALGTDLDTAALAERSLERYRERPDFDADGSLWMGETGLLVLLHGLRSSREAEDRLHELVVANSDNATNELMWGAPGTMLAAVELHARTGDQRWADAWRASADVLRSRWEQADEGYWIWTQDLYGTVRRFTGPAHGFVGNVRALLAGDDGRRDETVARAVATLEALARRDDGLATWAPLAGDELVQRDGTIRVQWCHGAPGIVATVGGLLPDVLARAAGELTWRAGPLAKGASLCHGTAGNGYAFLRLFELTGDELWLERARAFAVHALEQVERGRREHGRGWYSLWTGDPGAALYVQSCLDADARVPTIDRW
jgi:hypothetical protein